MVDTAWNGDLMDVQLPPEVPVEAFPYLEECLTELTEGMTLPPDQMLALVRYLVMQLLARMVKDGLLVKDGETWTFVKEKANSSHGK